MSVDAQPYQPLTVQATANNTTSSNGAFGAFASACPLPWMPSGTAMQATEYL
jgi:hypothetical protein